MCRSFPHHQFKFSQCDIRFYECLTSFNVCTIRDCEATSYRMEITLRPFNEKNILRGVRFYVCRMKIDVAYLFVMEILFASRKAC